MTARDELIDRLIATLQAGSTDGDILELPGWNRDTWRRLLADAEVIELANGELLLQKNEASNDLYFLVTGCVEVSVPQADGLTISAPVKRRPGSVVGEIAFLDQGDRTASVWSSGPSEVLRLPRPAFDAFRVAEPKIACDLVFAVGRIIARRLRRSIGAR